MEDKQTNGIIVGYTKSNNGSDVALVGLFIITEKKDSLLAFNVPASCINIDINALNYGAYNINGGNIRFDYRVAVGEEIKKNFLSPQNTMLPGFFHGQIDDYTQIIITNFRRR